MSYLQNSPATAVTLTGPMGGGELAYSVIDGRFAPRTGCIDTF